jgi:hypothetical protein
MGHGEIQPATGSGQEAVDRSQRSEVRGQKTRAVMLSVISYSLSGRFVDMSCLEGFYDFYGFCGLNDLNDFNDLTF